MEQLFAHLIGDYFLQSDWQALNKRKIWWIALFHSVLYSIPFLWLSPSLNAYFVILYTHALIDHYGIARYVVWAHNWIGTAERPGEWKYCTVTGFSHTRPDFITVWLLIITDNAMHLMINYAALRWL